MFLLTEVLEQVVKAQVGAILIAQYLYGYFHVRKQSNRGVGVLELCCINKIQKQITPITRSLILPTPKVAQLVKRLFTPPRRTENLNLFTSHNQYLACVI